MSTATIPTSTPKTASHEGRAEAALTAVTFAMPRVGLRELNELARLQTRVDTKYMLTPEQVVAVLDRIGHRLHVLDIDGNRKFGYESVYFDTRALRTFRDHRQGRRRRYKVRTRLYENSGECMLEVKAKNRRGGTVKRRMEYPASERFALNAQASEFVADVLREEYGEGAPELVAALVGSYARTTFVDAQEATRVTCDTGLTWAEADGVFGRSAHGGRGAGRRVYGPDLVLVETKSRSGISAVDLALRDLGIRPVRVSKYAIGTALLHPHLAANPWNRLLRNEFGWRREAVPRPA